MTSLLFAINIFTIVLMAYLFITAWSEVIIRSFIEYFDMNKEDISTWVKLGVISTILLFAVVIVSNVEIHDFFGISETVDVELTGMKERFQNGKVVHYRSK